MIRITIEDAEVKQCGQRDGKTGELGWAVVSHGICIVYADTKAEATAAREGINDLARQLRGIGHKVA